MDEVTFEHVVTVYETPDFEDGAFLQECSRCGALVMPAARQRHTEWHDKVDAAWIARDFTAGTWPTRPETNRG